MKTIKIIIIFAFLAILSINAANGQDHAIAEGFKKTADDFKSKSDPDNAIVYYEKAAIEFSKNGNTEKAIGSYNQIGALLNRQDKYDKANLFGKGSGDRAFFKRCKQFSSSRHVY